MDWGTILQTAQVDIEEIVYIYIGDALVSNLLWDIFSPAKQITGFTYFQTLPIHSSSYALSLYIVWQHIDMCHGQTLLISGMLMHTLNPVWSYPHGLLMCCHSKYLYQNLKTSTDVLAFTHFFHLLCLKSPHHTYQVKNDWRYIFMISHWWYVGKWNCNKPHLCHGLLFTYLCHRHSVLICLLITKLNFVAWVRERTIPTKRPHLVGEVRSNFRGLRVPCGQRDGSIDI
jgi:hypothetical protein